MFIPLGQCVYGQVEITGIRFADVGHGAGQNLGQFRGGLCVLDFDGDGYQDLLIGDTPGRPYRLFRNVPDGTRTGARFFADVTTGSGLDDAALLDADFGGIVCGDVDGDGDHDVLFIALNPEDFSHNLLYRNDTVGALPRFVSITASSGIRGTLFAAESASLCDYDLDGDMDAFVGAAFSTTSPATAAMYRNNGDGTFTTLTGIIPVLPAATHLYSHTWSDFDRDGWPDCLMIYNRNPPALLRNVADGAGGRRFVDVATQAGFFPLGPAPMGIALGDVDGDLDMDLGITDAADGTYFLNRWGEPPAPGQSGTAFLPVNLATSIFGWGCTFLDAENDGDVDHYQAGSWPASNVDRLFRNDHGVFANVSGALNAASRASQQCVRVDFNNDGREDIITLNPTHSLNMYENQSTLANHWVTIRLAGDGERVNTDGIGARVLLTAGGKVQAREVVSGSSMTSTEDLRVHFGLGQSVVVDQIQIIWPRRGTPASMTDTYIGPFAADQFMTIQPRSAADFDDSGSIDSQDFFLFIDAFFSGDPAADTSGNEQVDSQDYFEFLESFFGSP